MEIGVLSLSDIQANPSTGRPFPTGERIDEIVSYGMLADRLGLDVFGLGEHHSLDFAVSSPAVVLAAIAARTTRIRLASAVTVLTTLDPVRVYQDYASLDLLSHGRAEITAGRSAFAEPFALFGENPSHYDELFAEKLDLLLELRASDRVTWSGSFRPPLHDAQIAPRAVAEPLPVWVGVGGTPTSAQRAGRLGLPMALGLIGGAVQSARHTIDLYRQAGEEAGHHPDVLKVGIVSHFYAGGDPASARDRAFPFYHEYLRPKTPGGRGFVVDRRSFDAGSVRGGAIMIGSAEEITEKILDLRTLLGADRFLGQIDFGGLPRSMVEESIARLATEIAPTVRAH